MRKLSIVLCGVAAFLVIGCGSSDDNSSNGSSSIDNLEKEVIVGNEKTLLTPTTTENINDNEAYTTSDLGVIVPVEFPEPKKIEETDDNISVDDIVSSTYNTTSNIYSITNAKIIKKPLTSLDGKLAVLFNFNPKLPFDTTVAVTNYKSLLALPNNGLDLLKQGLVPIPEISGDIAYYDVNGNRMLDINKDLEFKDTNVSVYLFFKDVNLTEGKYKLYTYDYQGNYTVKDIEINNTTTNIVEAMNKISSFVIAQPGNVNEINVTLENLLPYLKVGIIALDENDNVVGVGQLETITNNTATIDNNLTFTQSVVAKLYILKQPSKYVYVSYFLKNGKKEVSDLTNISIEDFNTDKYPLDISSLTQSDKGILFSIMNYESSLQYWNELSNLIQPEKLVIDDFNESFSIDITNLVENYINNGKCNDENISNLYTSEDENVSVETSCNNVLILNLKYNGYNNYTKDLIISKNEDKFTISYQEYGEYGNEVINYTLNLKPYGRIISNGTQTTTSKWNDISNSGTITIKGDLKYLGDNYYLYTYNENFSQYYKYSDIETNGTKIESLSYSVVGNAKLYYNNETNNTSLIKHTYEVSNINTNEENVTINGKNFVYEKTIEGYTINMSPLEYYDY